MLPAGHMLSINVTIDTQSLPSLAYGITYVAYKTFILLTMVFSYALQAMLQHPVTSFIILTIGIAVDV
jgi:hypothetical protein